MSCAVPVGVDQPLGQWGSSCRGQAAARKRDVHFAMHYDPGVIACEWIMPLLTSLLGKLAYYFWNRHGCESVQAIEP